MKGHARNLMSEKVFAVGNDTPLAEIGRLLVLESISGVPVIEEAWQWNPRETLLRDYYANSLMTFDEVKRRGWPERKRGEKPVVTESRISV